MIRQISSYFESRILPFVQKYYPLAILKTDGEITKPVAYVGKANYQNINLDNFNGTAYIRQDGQATSVETGRQDKACKVELSMTYPVRLVFAIPREKTGRDDAFADDELVSHLVSALSGKNGALKASLKANSVSVLPVSWTTDAREVWNQETSGTGVIEPNMKLIYGAVNFAVTVEVYADCIESSCLVEC